MSEDVKDTDIKEKDKVVVKSDSVEDHAREGGWMPREDWVEQGKDPTQWRSAELFIELGPLYERIDSLKRENKENKKVLNEFKQFHEKVRETEYKRALEQLKVKKVEALQEGDANSVVDIDEKIAKVTAEEAAAKVKEVQVQSQEIHPDFANWVTKNTWYGSDVEMREFADSIGQAYAKSGRTTDPLDVLKYVEKKVRQTYPDKFRNPNKDKVSNVEGGDAPTKKTKVIDIEMNEEEERAMKKFVKSGLMTEAKYKEQLKQVRERV